MRRAAVLLAGTALVAAALAGCTAGPDFFPPAAPQFKRYTPEPLKPQTASAKVPAGTAQRFVDGLDIPGEWWGLFHSEPLNRLVSEAFKANPSIAAAEAALREARENRYATEGAFFPTVSGQAGATREKLSGASFGVASESPTLSVTTGALNISYVADVFGGVRRQIESAEAAETFQRFQLEATYLSLSANLVVAAITEASVRAEINATQEIIEIETRELGVLQRQFELGGASKAAVLAQQATLAQAQGTLPPLMKQLAQTRNQLAALAGRAPEQGTEQRFELASLHLPEELPVSLPSKLVEQRPDVKAAEAQLHAASANIGVAIANQLPQFAITGQAGVASLGFSQLFSPGTAIWAIGGSVAQTIFDGGTLLHKKQAAVAAFDQAAALYRSTVLTAFQNVADALRALESDAEAVKAQAAAVSSASDSLALSREQYQAGAITYTALLTAEQTYQQARIALVQAQANRYADTAALFQALGGGWWNRADVPPPSGEPARFALPPLPTAQN